MHAQLARVVTLITMSLQIVPADSASLVRRFIDVPWRVLGKGHPRWVPPLRIAVRDALDVRKNPFYENADRQLFIAMRDGFPVGRIAAIENRAHNRFHDDRVGFFGFFDVADDPEAARALFDAASQWLAARGLTSIRGPMNPSTNHECGLLVDGYDEHPMFMTTWNPPYYARLLEEAGFAGVQDLLGWHLPVGTPGYALPAGYLRLAERARKELGDRLSFRDLEAKNVQQEVDGLWDIYNSAWERNWGFVPMTRRDFEHLAKDLKQLVDPRFAVVAEVDGEPAGFGLALLDYHEIFRKIGNGRLLPTGIFKLITGAKRLRTLRMMALGVKPEHRTRGVFPLIVHELVRRALEGGMTGAEASWVLADNVRMNRPLEAMGATAYRRWRIYERPIGRTASPSPSSAAAA